MDQNALLYTTSSPRRIATLEKSGCYVLTALQAATLFAICYLQQIYPYSIKFLPLGYLL